MARWQLPPTVTTNSVTTSYGYDSVGNRLARSATSFPGLTPATYANYDANDRLGTLDGTKVAARFDPNGNTLQYNLDGNTSWDVTDDDEYDFENRLVRRKVASPLYSGGKRWIEIAYDGDGNRVTKTLKDWESGQNPTVDPPRSTSSTKYLVDDQNPSGYAQVLEERDGAGTLLVGYVYGLDLISQTRGNDTHYFGYDSLGTVRYLTDANANVTDIYTYDAFGILIERTARRTADGVLIAFTDPALQTAPAGTQPALNWYLYTGEQWDPDLGMYYLRARYYSPQIGRFWTMDSYEGSQADPLSLHKYLYANSNPLNVVDPTGHEGNYISLTATISLMYSMVTFELRGANAALKGARAMFGGDQNVNDLIHGMDVIDIVDENVGWVALGAGALAGGFKVVNMFRSFLGGSMAKRIAEKALLALQKLAPAARNMCFVAGTLVAAESGQIPIEEIKAGDRVWSWNEVSGEYVVQTVVNTTKRLANEITEIRLSGSTILATPEHPFWVERKGWVSAADLVNGDHLLTQFGSSVVVVDVVTREAETTVFNFEVENSHTYLVGNTPVVVHNDCSWGARLNSLPSSPGVYIMKTKEGMVYVGKADNILGRFMSHNFKPLDHEYLALAQKPDTQMTTFVMDVDKLNGASFDDSLSALEEFFIRITGSSAKKGSQHGMNWKGGMSAEDFEAYVSKFGIPSFKDPVTH